MVLWVGILAGAIFAWFAVKIGFYEMWVMLFNIVISIYLAVFLGPIIADIPVIGDMLPRTPYSNALAVIGTAIVSFLVLYGISYMLLTSRFSVPFPKIIDTLGTGFLGFLAGFLVWGFLGLLICITPISQQPIVKRIGFVSQFEQTGVPVICRWCNLVNAVASHQDNQYNTEEAISRLLKSVEKKTLAKTTEQAVSAEPNEPVEPNDVKTDIVEEEQPGPPPGPDAEDI